MNFLDLGLQKNIVDVLNNLNYVLPTEIQQKAIPTILKRQDAICRSETGSGKTFAFGLPIIQNIDAQNQNIQALIVCPTRELAMQVADEVKKIAIPLGVKVCAVFGGSTIARQVDSLKKNPQIVVGTTGRIMDLINKKALKIESANFVVLDEADEMLDMGFLPDIEKILFHTKNDRTTLMFSATMPKEVKILAEKYQKNAALIEIGTENKALDKIKQQYIFVDRKSKKEALKEIFYSDVYGKTIVFVNTKQFVDDVAHYLSKNSILCKAIHSDIRQNDRKRVLDSFKQGKIDVLIATDVASRGLDIKDVKWVINFDLPHELEFYVHRIGRTARAGESGSVVNIITSLEQLSYMHDIEKQTKAKITLFETKSENLKQYFVDTKKLAKKNNRFVNKQDSHKTKHSDTLYQNKNSIFDFELNMVDRRIRRRKDKKAKDKSFSNQISGQYLKQNNKSDFKNSKSLKKSKSKKRDNVSKHDKWYSKFKI